MPNHASACKSCAYNWTYGSDCCHAQCSRCCSGSYIESNQMPFSQSFCFPCPQLCFSRLIGIPLLFFLLIFFFFQKFFYSIFNKMTFVSEFPRLDRLLNITNCFIVHCDAQFLFHFSGALLLLPELALLLLALICTDHLEKILCID